MSPIFGGRCCTDINTQLTLEQCGIKDTPSIHITKIHV